MATTDDVRGPQRAELGKLTLAAVVGSVIEWFDFFIYGTASALIIGKLYFPGFSGLAGTLAAFGTFAVGFGARPLGGAIFGHFGDRFGRKPALVTALIMMGGATFLIGLVPTYDTIGLAAPVLLVVLRLVQGFAVGGQWGGSVLLMTEYAPTRRRGLYGSFPQLGAVAGLLVGNVVFLVLTASLAPETFNSWGWRVPFWISLLLPIIAVYSQLRLEDTPVFRELQQEQEHATKPRADRSPVLEVLRKNPRQILLAAGAFLVVNGAYYILITGLLAYGTENLGLSKSVMLAAILVGSATQFISMPAFAALTDKIGRRRPVYLAGAVLLAVWAFPLFWLLNTRSVALVFIAIIVALTFHSMMYGPQAVLYTEMFGARVRYSGMSLGYQIASVVGGGLAPLIMTALLGATGTSTWVSVYLIAMAAVTFASVYLIQESSKPESTEEPSTQLNTERAKR